MPGLSGRMLRTVPLWARSALQGPVPIRGLVRGRGVAQCRVVRLGGPKVRKARGTLLIPMIEVMFLCTGTLLLLHFLDLRRRLKAVMGLVRCTLVSVD